LLCEQFQTTKWVPDPIEERARAIQPWSMTLSQAGKSLTAPLDAALPFTTAEALSLAIGSFAPHPDPSRKVSPRAIVRSRRLITDCGSQLNCSVRHDELHQTLASILVDISDPRTTRQQRSAF
jgi:hypothetical protein